MSSLYEQWKPAVGDRVRIVERNEIGAAVQTGESGTVVALYPNEPEALCEVRYDAGERATRRHAAAELEPIGTKDADAEAWEPTVGDRVMTPGGREATVTAIDARPDGTSCEVEYNLRHKADYQYDNVTAEQAVRTVRRATRFVTEVDSIGGEQS